MADIDTFVRAEAGSLVAELSSWCAIPSLAADGGLPVNLKFLVEGEELARPEVVAALRAWRG